MRPMARNEPQVNLRMPAALKARLEEAAGASKRSLTAEIIARLEQSLVLPDLNIPEDLAARMLSASDEIRASRAALLIDELRDLFPPPPKKVKVTPENFYEAAVALMQDAPAEERPRLMGEIIEMMRKLTGNPDWHPLDWSPEE